MHEDGWIIGFHLKTKGGSARPTVQLKHHPFFDDWQAILCTMENLKFIYVYNERLQFLVCFRCRTYVRTAYHVLAVRQNSTQPWPPKVFSAC